MEPPPRTRVGRPLFQRRCCQAFAVVPRGQGAVEEGARATGGGEPGPCGPPGLCAAATGPGGGGGAGPELMLRREEHGPVLPLTGSGPEDALAATEKHRRSCSFPRRSFGAAVVVGVLPCLEGLGADPSRGSVTEPTGAAERGRDRPCPGQCGRQRGRARRGRRRPGPGRRGISEPGCRGNGTGSAHARCRPTVGSAGGSCRGGTRV